MTAVAVVAGGAMLVATRHSSAHQAPPSELQVASARLADAGETSMPATQAPAAVPTPAAPAAVSSETRPIVQQGGARVGTGSAPAAIVPVIPPGRRDLNPAMFAERLGDTVIVHFDTRDTRTRRPAKFERTVRETLPAVYGPVADSILARVPDGELTAGGDLIADLPARGIRLRAPNGAVLTLRPETRLGRDGPLVVSYRVTVAP